MYIYSSRSIASLIQLYHTIQKGLDDACVDSYSVALFPEMSPETDSTLCPALICYTLQEEDQYNIRNKRVNE